MLATPTSSTRIETCGCGFEDYCDAASVDVVGVQMQEKEELRWTKCKKMWLDDEGAMWGLKLETG